MHAAAHASTARRLADWQQRLTLLVQARLGEPFRWGANDCASFAADAAQALTGCDALHELRRPRRTAREAERQRRAIGGVEAAIQRAGLAELPPALAGRGDLVMLDNGGARVLALCVGEHAIAPGPQGLEAAPMALAVQAWRV